MYTNEERTMAGLMASRRKADSDNQLHAHLSAAFEAVRIEMLLPKVRHKYYHGI